MINRWIRGTGNAILAVGLLLLPGLPAPAQLPPAPESLGEEAPAPILRGVRLTGNTAFAAADLRSRI